MTSHITIAELVAERKKFREVEDKHGEIEFIDYPRLMHPFDRAIAPHTHEMINEIKALVAKHEINMVCATSVIDNKDCDNDKINQKCI
jgi:hypothetical protein